MSREEILALLDTLALRGNHLIVHASLSALGHVDGGAGTVCEALTAAVSEAGTLLVPTFTYETAAAGGSARTPHIAYHSDLPVSREIGAVAEVFRNLPGVRRSNHPTHSFAAWGSLAREVLSTQRDNNPLGPLKKLRLLQGQVLLLGTGLRSATVIHLAEESMDLPYFSRTTALRVNSAGHEERVVLDRIPGCSAAFDRLDQELRPGEYAHAPLASGLARKLPVRYVLGLATRALARDPYAFLCDQPGCASCERKRRILEGHVEPGQDYLHPPR